MAPKTLLTFVGLAIASFSSAFAAEVEAENHGHGHGHESDVEVIPSPSLTTGKAFLIKAHNGAVAADNEICSVVGVNILKAGGNAVDSAIATCFCSGVVTMFSHGLGGGGWMTVRVAPGVVYTIDFRETAPAKSNATMFNANPASSILGGLASGVPGEVRGLAEAHKRWGKLPWARLVQPAVELAANGWTVQKELVRRMSLGPALMVSPDWAPTFAPNGTVLKEGEHISRPNLAKTLAAIAKGGADVFYKGPIAKSIAAKVQATGGILTEEDLASYKPKVSRALQGTYRGNKIYSTNAPGGGAVLIHMLNLLERYNLKELSPLNVHRIVEAEKFAFAARTRISDPAFRNNTRLIDEVPKKSFANLVARNLTDNTTHPSEYYNPMSSPADHGTMHLVTVDKNRMSVSLTSTINYIFGNQVLDPVTGVILNNELDGFEKLGIANPTGLPPSGFNYPAPGKRPLSSTVPSIIENADGSLRFAVGAAGSTRIYTAVAQTIIHVIDRGLNVSGAIEQPRSHHTLYPNLADLDSGFSDEQVEGLKSRGHNVTVHTINDITSVVQGVVLDGKTLWAASDSRKNGVAAGY